SSCLTPMRDRLQLHKASYCSNPHRTVEALKRIHAMLRTLAAALLVGLVFTSTTLAEETIKGKVKTIDSERGSLTIVVDGQTSILFKVTRESRIVDEADRDLKGGLKTSRLKEGVEVTITPARRDDREAAVVKVGK